MNDNLHQRLALFSSLDCQVARRFADRPTLLGVAGELLVERWRQQQLGAQHDPMHLHLASHTAPGKAWVRPLVQVLVERYCQRHTLNLTPGEDFLTSHLDDSFAWQVQVDLHKLERLINEAAPALLGLYKQRLVDYWCRSDRSGQTPWSWYASYLNRQMADAIASSTEDGNLSGFARASAALVQAHPSAATRDQWPNAAGLTTSGLAIDLSADGKLDVDLSSAILIEHLDQNPTRNLTLLYTLTGHLFTFHSRQALLRAIARHWPADSVESPRRVYITPSPLPVFEDQALGVLNQQLRLIDNIAASYHSKLDAIAMGLNLDRLTSMIELCNRSETEQRQPLQAQLPDWLRDASSHSLMNYSSLLIDVTQGYQDVDGQSWLDGIATAEAFANQRLAARFAADHPGDTLAPDQVQVVNYQTIATALPGAAGPITTGEVTPVTFSLAQLAIGNLGLLKPGRVALNATQGTSLPPWMNETYLRTLISELDIGAAYPAMLHEKLLDDTARRAQRERLLTAQLKRQLPAMAMELFLRGKLPDSNSARHIAEVFNAAADDSPRWVLRPLAFLKAPDSDADRPRNTWLIEPQAPGAGPCLLYRPLHEDSLLSFPDHVALLVAIGEPGDLQDDMLSRLPGDVRRFYAHGGFLEPHLFVPLDDTSAIPFGTPAPVRLATTEALPDPGKALYLACVNESIERFREQSSTSAQTRWNSWKTLGWLLFNTLLPLAGSSLGKVAWLAQMEVALADYVDSDKRRAPIDQQSSLVNLLVNIAMLLFAHSIFRLRLEEGEIVAPQPPPLVGPVETEPLPLPTQPALGHLDFSWARPDRTLTSAQHTALQALQTTLKADALGTPIPAGPLRGLYLHGTRFYALLQGNVFEVVVDASDERARIVAPDMTRGPWLQRDESGRWQLDLRLRLKGGQPLSERLRKLRLENQQALRAADEQVEADRAATPRQQKALQTIRTLSKATVDDNLLFTCQGKLQPLAQFWLTAMENLRRLNALEAVEGFKQELAHGLYQYAFCQETLRNTLINRFNPRRQQIGALAKITQQGGPLTQADITLALERLETMDTLLDQLLDSNASLVKAKAEMSRLANRNNELINDWSGRVANLPGSRKDELNLRYQHLECLSDKVALTHHLPSGALDWRAKFWSSLQLCITQQLKLLELPDADDEIKFRLLSSLKQQFVAAERQLAVFTSLVGEPTAQLNLGRLAEKLHQLYEQTNQELAALPDHPATSTLQQLRVRLPGLIEVEDQGLLLGDRRADGRVEIPGPDSMAPSRVFQLKQGDWVELPAPKAVVAQGQSKLKHLLKGSNELMTRARDELERLQRNPGSFLPVEIQETLLNHRDLLQARADAIDQQLTASNQTDAASQGLDAEVVAKSLHELASDLAGQATHLRVNAALAQKPRMGEVQFLIEQAQVQVRREGARSALAKTPGRAQEFIDEYSISHQGRVLWYAHFHYLDRNTASADFTVGHLKTAAQRYKTGRDVYYREITHIAAQRYFFDH